MAAQFIETDHEFAFRLQLEEAITASLAFQQPIIPEIKSETKKFSHDQTPTHEILHMPEDQYKVIGNSIHRPFGEGPSSSSKTNDSEVFKVYFKGLVSEERVKSNKTVTMAGIGVAVCDSKDELLFEMRKPLELNKDDRISKAGVEAKALIEALRFAISMDVNRILLHFDYHTLYQHVSGKWRPKQEKIKRYVDEVNILRESFTQSKPLLIAKKDVKFAIKFAREAINSQILTVQSGPEMLENCVICLDDKSVDQFFSVKGCNHRYCDACMKQHVEVKLLHGVVPVCPHEGCKSELKIENCKVFLTPKLTEMMRQRVKEASIPVTEKVYCPYPKCSTLMSKTELLQLPRIIDENGARTCYKCQGNFCINCKVPWHKNMDCAEYKRRNPTQLVEESKLKNLAARNLWRQCIKCKHMIELATGCYHMTCRCGYEFCYTCGAEWKNKKATCACPLWDEENIVDAEEEDDFDIMGWNEEEHELDAAAAAEEEEDDFDIMGWNEEEYELDPVAPFVVENEEEYELDPVAPFVVENEEEYEFDPVARFMVGNEDYNESDYDLDPDDLFF